MIFEWIRRAQMKRAEAKQKRRESGVKTGVKQKIKAEKTILAMLGLLILIRVVIGLGGSHQPVEYVPLSVAGNDLYLEYSTGKSMMRKGLKNRPGIMETGGMIFDLKELQKVTVTMDQVNFPLKVMTMDPNFKVLEVQTLKPGQEDVSFQEPCLYFAEVHPDVAVEKGEVVREFNSTLNLSTVSLVKKGVF